MSFDLFMVILPHWAAAFAFTLVVEVPLFVLLGRFFGGFAPDGRPPVWRLAIAGATGTCLTHPLLWFVWPQVVSDYGWYIASGELLIAIIESFTFFALARPIALRRAVAASFIANGASWGLGILLRALGLLS